MRVRSFLTGLLTVSLLASMPARAEMIGTGQLLSASAEAQRDQVSTFLAREDVRQQMVKLGVDPADAAVRVASLTDEELQTLSARIDSLPAGGTGALELVLVVFLVLLILELAGAIDIFKKI